VKETSGGLRIEEVLALNSGARAGHFAHVTSSGTLKPKGNPVDDEAKSFARKLPLGN
jgi:hypothetical protein